MAKRSPRIVTVGGMRIDYLITREGQLRNGLMGGNALYSAAGASLWSDSVGVWAKIGRNYPEEWIDKLQNRGLDISGIVNVSGDQDHRTFYAYSSDGQRHDTDPDYHYERIGQQRPEVLNGYIDSTPGQDDPDEFEPLAIRPSDWPDSYESVEGVHLAPSPLSSHLRLPNFLREKLVRMITVDPGERYMVPGNLGLIRRFLPNIDVFLPSKQEVISLLGTDIDMTSAAFKFIEWGVKAVIIKCGRRGVLVLERGAKKARILRPFHHDGDKRITDITGAGDAFCGGFLAGLVRIEDFNTALLYGLVSSSMVLEGYGAPFALALDRDKAYARLAYLQIQHRNVN